MKNMNERAITGSVVDAGHAAYGGIGVSQK